MGKYLCSENLKFKRTFSRKIIVIAPLAVAVFALIIGGFVWFQSFLMYWWYGLILSGILALVCGLANQREGRGEKYSHVFTMPINLKKFWIAKNVISMWYFFWMQMVLLLIAAISYVLAPATAQFTPIQLLVGVIIIFVTSIWQIPLCTFLSKKIGLYITIMVNTIIGLFAAFACGNSILVWIVPYCWVAKAVEYSIGIKVSGEVGKLPGFQYSGQVILLCIMSLVLSAVIMIAAANWFEKLEEK